ncbi:unnamed protein product [Caenorhabditis nigoni]
MGTPPKEFSMKLVVENIPRYDDSEYSATEEHFGVPWKIEARNSEESLSFYLHCLQPKIVEWSIETSLEFKVSSGIDSFISKHERCYRHSAENNAWGWNDLMSIDKLLDHSRDGNSTETIFEIKVEIKSMTGCGKENIRNFDESVKECSDVVLVVNDREFYLSKYFLALQSTYFKTLLLGNFDESHKNKIELKDINPDDFQNFLELIHGESSLDDETVSGILHLADMYDTPTAIRRCEEFLLKNSQKTMPRKLQISLRYNLENLKNKCLSEITTIADIQSIVSLNFKEMDLSTSQALLQKSLEFSNKS